MVRVIGYRRFGGVQVLEEEECTLPQPGKGQVVVHMRAAGINPVDYKLFGGITKPWKLSALSRTPHVGSLRDSNESYGVWGRILPGL